MYHQNTQNGQQEPCGCGIAAEIAYMGHKSTCEEFQWEFWEFQQQHKRPRLQSPTDTDTKEGITKDDKIDDHMDNPSTSTNASDPLTVLAEVAQSHSSQSSLPDLIGEQNGGVSWLPMWRRWRNATIGRWRHYRTVSYEENWKFQGLKGV